MKPFEVEILVAQVGSGDAPNEMFHILYDGTVMDEQRFTVLGGQAEQIGEALESRYEAGLSLGAATQIGAAVLAPADGDPLMSDQLEVGVLERSRPRRAFRRIRGDELSALLGS
jgi:proteasome alpha subunit